MCLSVALFVGALTLFLTNGLLCVILYKDDIYGRSALDARRLPRILWGLGKCKKDSVIVGFRSPVNDETL